MCDAVSSSSSFVRSSSSFVWSSSPRACWSDADWLSDVKCVNPFVQHGAAFGCGRCIPCLIDRRRIWTMRLMLENLMWRESTFISLTYSDEFLPVVSGWAGSSGPLATLVPVHFTKWLKRLRKAIAPAQVRYYGVGEYGSLTQRPHYHVAVFGLRGCDYEDSRLSASELCKCVSCVLVRKSWPFGFVHQGTIELKSMQYLMKYMLKGMRRRDDGRLRGREPEFSRMSLRPGIGAIGMYHVSEGLRYFGLEKNGSAPAALRVGERILPLGKYLRKKIRQGLGGDGSATELEVQEARERMRPLYEIAARFTDGSVSKTVSDKLLYRVIVEANREKARQLEAREKIFKGV